MARGKPKAKFGSDNSTSDGSLSYHADSGGVVPSSAVAPPPPPDYNDEENPPPPPSSGGRGKPVPVPSKSSKKIVAKDSMPPPPPPAEEDGGDVEDERKYMTSDELKHSREGEKSEPLSAGRRSHDKLINHKSSDKSSKMGKSGKIDAMEITYKTEASAWPGDFDRFSPMDRSRTGTSLAFIPPAAGNAPEPRPSMSGSMRRKDGPRRHKRGQSAFNGDLGENANANKRYWILLNVIIVVFSLAFMILEFNRQDWKVGKVGSENIVLGPPGRLVLAEYAGKGTLRFTDNYEIYRLFSPAFIHSGVIHFLIAIVLFLVTGTAVEQHFGHVRFAVIFLLTTAYGILTSMLFVPYLECIGLTIPTFGMIGALIADFIQNRRKLRCGTGGHLLILSVCAMVGIVIGFFPFFVDNYAHFGALLGGFFIGLATLIDTTPDVDVDGRFVRPRYQFPLRIFGVTWYLLILIALVVPIALDVDWAPAGLEKAACITTSVWECNLPKYLIQN